MPDTVIDRVNTLGGNQHKLLIFADRYGRLIGDTEIQGVGDNSYEGGVQIPAVNAELE